MKPDGKLSHSEQPATYSYPGPDKSSPRISRIFPDIQFNIIPSSSFSKWSLSLTFLLQNPVSSSLLLIYVQHAPSISSLYLVKITHYVFFSIPPYPVPLRPKCLHQHFLLENCQPIFLRQCESPSFTHMYTKQMEKSVVYTKTCA